MSKKKAKKTPIICAVGLIIILAAGFGVYKYSKNKTFNSLITSANKYMDSGDYDKAIALYNQALDYKNDDNIKNKVELAEKLNNAKKFYDDGVKYMNNKEYTEAIEQFNKITKDDDKLYNNVQEKMDECKKQLIADAINLIKKSKYDDAAKDLDAIIKIDSDNTEAKNLQNIIKTQQDKAKKEQDEKAKADDAAVNGLTKDDAIKIVKKKFNYSASSIRITYDHDSQHDGKSFYVIHVFVDQAGGSETLGWYGVEKTSGRIYNEMEGSYVN